MKPQAVRQRGFVRPIVIWLVLLFVVISVGGIGYTYYSFKKKNQEPLPLSAAGDVCASAPKYQMPVDPVSIKSVAYPGQERPAGSGRYASYATFIVRSDTNEAMIKLPADARLLNGSRYSENGEEQYSLEFEARCGYRFRFDHLLQLSIELQDEVAGVTPVTSDKTLKKLSGKEFLSGTLVATRVGYGKTSNGFFDYGLYNFTKQNPISSNKDWSSVSLHQSEDALHGLCWLDYLLPDELEIAKLIKPTEPETSKKSDYCDAAY